MAQPIQPHSFASGLESFGSVDWDAEFDELAAVEDMTCAQSESENLQPEGQEATNTALLVENSTSYHSYPDNIISADHTPPYISASPNWTVSADTMSNEYEDLGKYSDEMPAVAKSMPEVNAEPPSGSFTTWEHPGWSWSESGSWYEWTATSPEVSSWALSPGIQSDADWIIGVSRHGDDYAHDDIPRIASILRRAYDQAYDVSENAGVCYPALARGFKAVPRRGTVNPREQCKNRGAKGLWKRWELECFPPGAEYIPIGETSQMRMGVYLPQPSRLSDVWTVEDEEEQEQEMGEEDEKEGELVESSEEEWACFDSSSSSGDEEEADGATPATASVESLPDRVVVSTPTIIMKPTPLRPRPVIDCDDSENDDNSIADEMPATPSEPTSLITPPPCTPVRACDAHLQDQSPNKKLTGPGYTRDMASPQSPVLLGPALALRDMNAGKKLAPPKTLYQNFVEQHDDMATEQNAEERNNDLWTNAAAAAVAVVGGMVMLLV